MGWQRGEDHAPQAFIDAGDLPWPRLEPILSRTVIMLAPGEIVELRCGNPVVIGAIGAWCEELGYILLHREPGDGFVTFWIGRKDVPVGEPNGSARSTQQA